jgi:hypothetical protein
LSPSHLVVRRLLPEGAVLTVAVDDTLFKKVTVVWYALHGHRPSDASDRRERARWYTTKTYPSVSDMGAKLRRVIAARFLPTSPGRPTNQEIRAVQQAWAAASLDTAA